MAVCRKMICTGAYTRAPGGPLRLGYLQAAYHGVQSTPSRVAPGFRQLNSFLVSPFQYML